MSRVVEEAQVTRYDIASRIIQQNTTRKRSCRGKIVHDWHVNSEQYSVETGNTVKTWVDLITEFGSTVRTCPFLLSYRSHIAGQYRKALCCTNLAFNGKRFRHIGYATLPVLIDRLWKKRISKARSK